MPVSASVGTAYGRLRIVPMPAVRALNPVRGMPFRWSFNPYRGCAHGCRYCYARRTHEYLGYNAADDFDRIILAKLDSPRLLEQELGRPGWRRELVAVGTATDPYQPPEGRLRLTRQSLAVFLAYRTPVSLVTKSTLVVRDRDLLAGLSREAPGSTVWVTITTLDRALARRVEPGAPPPHQRLRAVRMLAAAGVRVGVMVAPVMPGLTDDPEGLRQLVEAAAAAGARDVVASPLRLCEGAREVYLAWLQRAAPGLGRLYRALYGDRAEAELSYRRHLELAVQRLKRGAGLPEPAQDPSRPGRWEQAEFDWDLHARGA